MSEEEQAVEDYELVPRPAQTASVQAARPRHSLRRRLARAAFTLKLAPALSSSSSSFSSRIPVVPERATGLFRSGALETHIARALETTAGLDGNITTAAKQTFFSAVKNCSVMGEGVLPLQLLGKRLLGPSTVYEARIQGTKVSLLELQLKMVHTLTNPLLPGQTQPKPAGQIAVITASDLQSRHRFTVDTTLGSEQEKHSLSTVVSSDLQSRLSWGLASSFKVNEKLVIFSRYNNDAYAGQRVVFQAVSKVDSRNTFSPICAITLGNVTQGGLSWTRSFSQHGGESVQVKGLCSSNGSYMVSVNAQRGEVES